MKLAIFGLLFASGILMTQGLKLASCTADADCKDGCCIRAKDGSGMVCQLLGKENDICDLEGQGLAEGVCACQKGLSCEKIDLGVFGKEAEAANPIFEKRHYGWCMWEKEKDIV